MTAYFGAVATAFRRARLRLEPSRQGVVSAQGHDFTRGKTVEISGGEVHVQETEVHGHLDRTRAGDVRGGLQEEGAATPAATSAAAGEPSGPRHRPARPAPVVAQFTAEPTSIQRGQSSTLRWEVTGDATSVSIDQTIGTVQNAGNRRVFPSDSTTYTLTATGPGGSTTASATVNGDVACCRRLRRRLPAGRFRWNAASSRIVQDIYFDYDKSDIRGDARDALTRDARALKSHPDGLPERLHRGGGPLRRARLRRVQPRPGRPPRQLRQGVPGATRRSRRPAEDHQLRQGAAAVHRVQRIVLAEEPARALLARPVGIRSRYAEPAAQPAAGG